MRWCLFKWTNWNWWTNQTSQSIKLESHRHTCDKRGKDNNNCYFWKQKKVVVQCTEIKENAKNIMFWSKEDWSKVKNTLLQWIFKNVLENQTFHKIAKFRLSLKPPTTYQPTNYHRPLINRPRPIAPTTDEYEIWGPEKIWIHI